jgi:hypothetical protein
MARLEYNPKAAALKVMQALPPEQQANKDACIAALKKAKLNLHPITVGKLWKKLAPGSHHGTLVNGSAASVSGTMNEGVLLANIAAVTKAAKATGSLANLKATIAIIEKVKAI